MKWAGSNMGQFTAAEWVLFFGGIVTVIGSLVAGIISIIAAVGALRKDVEKSEEDAKERGKVVAEKLGVIHELTNSNLASVKADLLLANERIGSLQNLVGRMVGTREVKLPTLEEADALAPALVQTPAPSLEPPAPLHISEINADTINANTITEKSAGQIATQIADKIVEQTQENRS